MTPPATAPPTVPMVLPPVTADPAAPPSAAPPTVPTVSPVLPQPAMPRAAASAILRTMKTLLMLLPPVVKMAQSVRSGATAQQEDHEQHRDGHTEGPEQDVAELAFLLPTPLL